jgi:hypothetical protein
LRNDRDAFTTVCYERRIIAGPSRIPADIRFVCCSPALLVPSPPTVCYSLSRYTMLTAVPLRSEHRTSPVPASILAYITVKGSRRQLSFADPRITLPTASLEEQARIPIPNIWSLGLEYVYVDSVGNLREGILKASKPWKTFCAASSLWHTRYPIYLRSSAYTIHPPADSNHICQENLLSCLVTLTTLHPHFRTAQVTHGEVLPVPILRRDSREHEGKISSRRIT